MGKAGGGAGAVVQVEAGCHSDLPQILQTHGAGGALLQLLERESSNVDVYSMDKRRELETRIKEMKVPPSIICLQEVKPKNYRYERTTAGYTLDGHEITEQNLHSDIGRGLIIYVRKDLCFITVELTTKYEAYCCVEVSDKRDKILVTNIYCSPSSDQKNNSKLLQLLQEVSDANVQYKIVLGDFNLPRIKWSNYTTDAGPTDFNTQFIEKI